MSDAVLRQDLTFSGDKSTSGSKAYFPASMRGQYLNWTVYVEYSGGSSAGKVQIETAFADQKVTPGIADYTGTWANLGSTIDWATGASGRQKTASVVGIFDLLGLEITTTVTSGTAKAWVIASPQAP